MRLKPMCTCLLACAAATAAIDAFAMDAETKRMAVWLRGETIEGEEFIAASEEIVDYLATLRRPTDGMRAIRYNCAVKSRLIRPSVVRTGTPGSEWIEVRMVYELRDCVEAR